jgi:hypothetical protein
VIGGGASISGGDENVALQISAPSGTSWTATATETDDDSGNWSLTAYVICAATT